MTAISPEIRAKQRVDLLFSALEATNEADPKRRTYLAALCSIASNIPGLTPEDAVRRALGRIILDYDAHDFSKLQTQPNDILMLKVIRTMETLYPGKLAYAWGKNGAAQSL